MECGKLAKDICLVGCQQNCTLNNLQHCSLTTDVNICNKKIRLYDREELGNKTNECFLSGDGLGFTGHLGNSCPRKIRLVTDQSIAGSVNHLAFRITTI
jgi:hypothetical protein